MRRSRPVTVGMRVPMVMAVGMGRRHEKMLYYNIRGVHLREPGAWFHGFPTAIAIAAARNGNGSETAARNQTNRAGMKGIYQSIRRWKANSAHATT